MRLIHTADVHLDRCFASAHTPPGFGNRRRQSLRDVFHAIVRRAGEWPADALLIAGDLFDLERVTRDTVRFLQAEFESIRHVPVCIAPGNTDPFVPGSPYAEEEWPGNVMIFDQPQWRSFVLDGNGTTVHGFGFDGPDVPASPFGTFPPIQLGATHVAVAHASALGHQPPGKAACAPFEPATAAVDGLRYLALGHFHAYTPISGPCPTVMAYSGAPEGLGFDETGMRHYLEVKIDGDRVHVTPVASARSVYLAESIDCSALSCPQELIESIRALPREEGVGVIAHITLTGSISAELRAEMDAIHDAVASRFEQVFLNDRTELSEDMAALARHQTSLGGFVARLNAALADAASDRERRLLARARELGLAAYRNRPIAFQGLERD
ncbi:MAG TPA: metallophosphoesterase [Candidatus Hydrogenedentes bacterium]|jgi:DNA repair exonuclease SbcCD nuclease subunit|nr:metallophosphoesterase [Candidatus Hydrogenedentota bacterium]HPJ98580.1 metallophosphoesterase [Candidatus Hydrogenedentota bacterium]